MRKTNPFVELIAVPQIRWDAVERAVTRFGDGPYKGGWFDRVYEDDGLSDAELLVEYAGRRCYRSWMPELNANVTKVREDSQSYLQNILKSKHGAVLEHAQLTFDFHDVSRVFTHELVRHRAGVAISQESLRYVRLTDIGFRMPPVFDDRLDNHMQNGNTVGQEVVSIIERLEDFQREAAEIFGLDEEGVPFHYKKEVTSALRRLAPLGLSTGMVWSANFRTLRHVIPLRTAAGAEEEIRLVFHRVAQMMCANFPMLFGDMQPVPIENSDVPAWVPMWEKV